MKRRSGNAKPATNTKSTQPNTATIPHQRQVYVRWTILLVLAAFALYYLVPRLGELRSIGEVMRSVNLWWLGGGVIAAGATLAAATATVIGASRRRLSWNKTLTAQLAATALNRITPKGVGSIALLEQYLEKQGLKRPDAAAAVTLVYSAGVALHVVLLVAALIFVSPDEFRLLPARTSRDSLVIIGVSLLLMAAGLLVLRHFRGAMRVVRHWAGAVKRGLAYNLSHPRKCLLLFGGSAAITMLHVVGLYCGLQAVGATLDIGSIALIYLAGSALASASPTPGSLGAIEAALAVGLSAAGISLEQAVAGVLIFRLTSFWLPIVPGAIGLRLAIARKLI